MKTIVLAYTLLAFGAALGQAQGLVSFGTGAAFSNRISTNAIVGGAAVGPTAAIAGQFYYALYYSPNATSVNGQTAAIVGGANNNYAFNDSNWKFAGYATNTTSIGRFSGNSSTVITNVAGGATCQFVIIGWSANIGNNMASVQGWFNEGNPVYDGWVGQSAVSGVITLGDGGMIITPSVMGASPLISGFVLGQVMGGLFVPPYVVMQPTNQSLAVGGTTGFTVVANGDPSLSLSCQWQINGTNIIAMGNGTASSTNYFDVNAYAMKGVFTLTVSNAQLINGGNYSALISNGAGSVISSNAFLAVQAGPSMPPSIVIEPMSQYAPCGSNVILTVSASGADPLNYQWSFNGTNLVNATNATLALNNVQPMNSGNYSVFVTNFYGSTNSTLASLTVQIFPPIILAQPQNRSVQAGNSATFTVTASGTAPMNYQWTFNGTNLPGATGSALTISGVQVNNTGNYRVTITNLYGVAQSDCTVLTVVPPSGYVIFANNNNSATKIFTNSVVGGPVTGLTSSNFGSYNYALFASTSTTSVNGITNAILGNANNYYAFTDSNWTLVAYGKNTAVRGRLTSASTDNYGQTPIIGFAGGSYVRFVLIGWAANIGTNITAVQSWFNAGSPASDGWIGQSAVSGSIMLGDGGIIASPVVVAFNPPALQGFTLGLASPNPAASYQSLGAPPPVLRTTLVGASIKLSWSAYYSSYDLQSSSGPVGPWNDVSGAAIQEGTNLTKTVPLIGQQPFFRLIVQ